MSDLNSLSIKLCKLVDHLDNYDGMDGSETLLLEIRSMNHEIKAIMMGLEKQDSTSMDDNEAFVISDAVKQAIESSPIKRFKRAEHDPRLWNLPKDSLLKELEVAASRLKDVFAQQAAPRMQ